MRTLRAFLVAALASGAAVRLPAQVVVVNGGAPNGGAGWNIFDDNQASTSFSTASAITFDAIRFWGILPQATPYGPDIFWQILSDAGGAPGSIVASGDAVATATLRTAIADPGFFSWQFDLAVASSQTLGTGMYWLALHDGPLDPSGFTGSSLIWETSDAAGAFDIQTFSIDQTWNAGGNQALAFQLQTTAAPEPATLLLVATGLIGVLYARHKRERTNRSLPRHDASASSEQSSPAFRAEQAAFDRVPS